MALMTMIARVVDGLPLVGTMTEDEQVRIYSLKKLENKLVISNCWISVWEKCPGVSKSGKNVVPQIGATITTQMLYRNRSILIPVSFYIFFILQIFCQYSILCFFSLFLHQLFD